MKDHEVIAVNSGPLRGLIAIRWLLSGLLEFCEFFLPSRLGGISSRVAFHVMAHFINYERDDGLQLSTKNATQ